MNQRYCNGIVHEIKEGENLYRLSRKYRVPLALILRANPYVDVYNLLPGQEICIPVSRPRPGMMSPFLGQRPQNGTPPQQEIPSQPGMPSQPGTSSRQEMPQENYANGPESEMTLQAEDKSTDGEEKMRRETLPDDDKLENKMAEITEEDFFEEEDKKCANAKEMICESECPLGEILRREDISISDFLACNPPDRLILAKGTRLVLIDKEY